MKTQHKMDEAAVAEAWLDQLDPDEVESRSPERMNRISAAAELVEDARRNLWREVEAARAAGDSWSMVGVALGISRQAAFQRYGRK